MATEMVGTGDSGPRQRALSRVQAREGQGCPARQAFTAAPISYHHHHRLIRMDDGTPGSSDKEWVRTGCGSDVLPGASRATAIPLTCRSTSRNAQEQCRPINQD